MLNNHRNIPYAIQSFSKNISIEQIDSIFYNVEAFVLTLVDKAGDQRMLPCNALISNMIAAKLFKLCDTSCAGVQELCIQASCDSIMTQCFGEDETFSDKEQQAFVDSYGSLVTNFVLRKKRESVIK